MRLISIDRGNRTLFCGLLFLALGQSLIVMVPAWAVQQLFDSFGPAARQSHTSFGMLVAIFIGMASLAFLVEIGKRRVAAEMALRHAAALRLTLFRHQLTNAGAQQRNKGSMLLPFVGDLTAARRWVGEGLARGASATILIPVMLAIIATRSTLLALALAGVLLISLMCSTALVRPMDNAVREVRKRRGLLTSFIAGRIQAAATIEASGRAQHELRKVVSRTARLSAAERRRAWIAGTTRGAAQFTNSLLILTTLLVGTHEAAQGSTTPGEIAAILSLVGLMSAGVTDVARAIELWQPAKVAYERIRRVLRASGPRRRSTSARVTGQGLLIKRLNVSDRLSNVEAAAFDGDVILIDGPPAAGKSALISAIAQLSPRTSGKILLEGRDLRSLRNDERRELVGFASTELPLLPGSLGMNLRYRHPKTKDLEILELARHCGLGPLVDRLPQGLDSRVTSEVGLSAGERQGLAIGRAILGRPRLLLIDSADNQLEESVIAWLAGQAQHYPGIVLMIASRPELRMAATRRWTMAGGTIVADEVLEQSQERSDERIVPFERPAK